MCCRVCNMGFLLKSEILIFMIKKYFFSFFSIFALLFGQFANFLKIIAPLNCPRVDAKMNRRRRTFQTCKQCITSSLFLAPKWAFLCPKLSWHGVKNFPSPDEAVFWHIRNSYRCYQAPVGQWLCCRNEGNVMRLKLRCQVRTPVLTNKLFNFFKKKLFLFQMFN